MAETHDQHLTVRRQIRHRGLHGVAVFGLHLRGQMGGKHLIAAVNPAHRKRQVRQHLHQSPPNMPTAKQGHRRQDGRQTLLQQGKVLV